MVRGGRDEERHIGIGDVAADRYVELRDWTHPAFGRVTSDSLDTL